MKSVSVFEFLKFSNDRVLSFFFFFFLNNFLWFLLKGSRKTRKKNCIAFIRFTHLWRLHSMYSKRRLDVIIKLRVILLIISICLFAFLIFT